MAVKHWEEGERLKEIFQKSCQENRLGQAFLFIGEAPALIFDWLHSLAALILCEKQGKMVPLPEANCSCKSCLWVQKRIHPDLHYILLEEGAKQIKIEQIRDIQQQAFISPQCGKYRLIIISPAEAMNIAASNALLKLLEEPPADVIFLLQVQHAYQLPATIRSRCQSWSLNCTAALEPALFDEQAGFLLPCIKDFTLKEVQALLLDLSALKENPLLICSTAEKWAGFPLEALFSLIYLMITSLLKEKFLQRQEGLFALSEEISATLLSLGKAFHPVELLAHLDCLHALMKSLRGRIALNAQLAFEQFLQVFLRTKE